MRDVDDKLAAHLVDLLLLLDLLGQLLVGRAQLADGFLQMVGQQVERLAQLPDLVGAPALVFLGEVQPGHRLGHLAHLDERLGEVRCQKCTQRQTDEQRHHARDDQKSHVEHGILLHIGERDALNQIIVAQFAHQTQEILAQVTHLDGHKVYLARVQLLGVGCRQRRLDQLFHAPVGKHVVTKNTLALLRRV